MPESFSQCSCPPLRFQVSLCASISEGVSLLHLSFLQWQAAVSCYSVLGLEWRQGCFMLYFPGLSQAKSASYLWLILSRSFLPLPKWDQTSSCCRNQILGPRGFCVPPLWVEIFSPTLLCVTIIFEYIQGPKGFLSITGARLILLLLFPQNQWISAWSLWTRGSVVSSSSGLRLLLCKEKNVQGNGQGFVFLPPQPSEVISFSLALQGSVLSPDFLITSNGGPRKELAHKCNFPLCLGHPAIPN